MKAQIIVIAFGILCHYSAFCEEDNDIETLVQAANAKVEVIRHMMCEPKDNDMTKVPAYQDALAQCFAENGSPKYVQIVADCLMQQNNLSLMGLLQAMCAEEGSEHFLQYHKARDCIDEPLRQSRELTDEIHKNLDDTIECHEYQMEKIDAV